MQPQLGIRASIVSVATTLVAAAFSPLLAPGPGAPAEPPVLWAVLGWVSREIQRTFFNRTPNAIDDGKASELSEQIARKIERDLQYPGQIKVVVIRETRAVDFAR